jgi:hypothetical protein
VSMFFINKVKDFIQNIGVVNGGLEQNPEFDRLIEKLVSEAFSENLGFITVTKRPTYNEIKIMDPQKKVDFVFYLTHGMAELGRRLDKKKAIWGMDEDLIFKRTYEALLFSILRMNLHFQESSLISLLDFYYHNSPEKSSNIRFYDWPVALTIVQLEKYVKENGLSDQLRDFIKTALLWPQFNENTSSWGSDVQKAKLRLQTLVYSSDNAGSIPPCKLLENDVIGKYINEFVDGLAGDIKDRVYEIFHLSLSASGSKPSEKYLDSARSILSRTNTLQFKSYVHDWLSHLIDSKPIDEIRSYKQGEDHEYTWVQHTFLLDRNATLIKGLVWSLSQFHDESTIEIISKLAERSFEKIPGVGPTCSSVGNACIFCLANCKGMKGISHLSRLKLKITQNNARELISKYIQEESQKRGVTSAELEEQAVPEFELKLGTLEESFEDYKLRVSLIGIGKTEMEWFNPEGGVQKSTPAFVKNTKKYSDKLLKIRNTTKQIQKHSTAQRDRIDRSYIENREWAYSDFIKHYLYHGLVSFIARKLIWVLNNNGDILSAIWRNERWEDIRGNEVKGVGESTKVRLWHPLFTNTEEVMLWRKRLEELKIQQPLKQAYREIYILTEAELRTLTYSNRMAAHLLKQHQFNALAALRGWKYKLLGNYDDGRDGETAKIKLPAYNITCEYWINEIYSDHAYNDAGIWDYVSTDQVRFVNEQGEAINLVDIPKIVFSELMRDVDLFVGVSSVGNDPEWIDSGGNAQYRDYWTRYSFGDLTEVANTRKTVLEQLLPRLKIRDQAYVDGKFLRVKGKIREYKIHIGSTNILMEPNDQYLCIVPARSDESVSEKVFLPFEGDRGLSIILSKAMLLAADDKITDQTILNQISRK